MTEHGQAIKNSQTEHKDNTRQIKHQEYYAAVLGLLPLANRSQGNGSVKVGLSDLSQAQSIQSQEHTCQRWQVRW